MSFMTNPPWVGPREAGPPHNSFLLRVREWQSPGASGRLPKAFTSDLEKFGYNNWSSGEILDLALDLATRERVTVLEVDLPFGVFTLLFRDSDIGFNEVGTVAMAKLVRSQDGFACKYVSEKVVTHPSPNFTLVQMFLSEDLIGHHWDQRCLGLAISFGIVHDIVWRPPFCSYMRKAGKPRDGRRYGKRVRVGLPVSSFWIGNELYLTVGEYLGLGFSGDAGRAQEFLLAYRLPRSDHRTIQLINSFERAAPSSGATANCISISYLCALECCGDVVDITPDAWGRLFMMGIKSSGVTPTMNPVTRRWCVTDSDTDRIDGNPHFMLVEVIEAATLKSINSENIVSIQYGDDTLMINNDLAGYMRGRMNNAVEFELPPRMWAEPAFTR